MSKLIEKTLIIKNRSTIFIAMNSKTAILVFAQTASEECKKKHFLNGRDLFSILNHQTLKVVKKTQLPFFIFTEKEQIGNSFGERFTNAIAQVFEKGFTKVITIGNDCPEMKSKQLIQASQNFLESKTTIGPTLDGGFYLLAFHKNQFDEKAFLNLPWQKKSLRKELISLLNSKQTVISILRFFNDLDNLKDIDYFLSHKNAIAEDLFKLLQFISISKPNFPVWSSIKSNYISNIFNKGSPY